MTIQVLAFGVLKEKLGGGVFSVELQEGATVATLLQKLTAESGVIFRGIAVSVNQQYARPGDVIPDGAEVGLLPPVSGGFDQDSDSVGAQAMSSGGIQGRLPLIAIELSPERIDARSWVAQAKSADDGALVIFEGIVRGNSRGRRTLYLEYEAYVEMAVAKLDELAREARERLGVRHVAIVHRLGRVDVSETSVLIIVTAAHRAAAYEASRWLIDTLKTTVPIWKKETFEDGAVWNDGEPFPAGVRAVDVASGAGNES